MHPSNEIEKVYIAKIDGIITGEEIRTIKNGIILDNIKCIPKRVKLRKTDKKNKTSIVEIIIVEGKNHEVKRLFSAVNLKVLKLKRERVAFLSLGNLKSGEYREVQGEELSRLYQLCGMKQ